MNGILYEAYVSDNLVSTLSANKQTVGALGELKRGACKLDPRVFSRNSCGQWLTSLLYFLQNFRYPCLPISEILRLKDAASLK